MRRTLALALGLLLWAYAPIAHASEVTGTWTAGPLRVSWAIGDWGEACGPRPSGGGESGGTVQLTAKGADFELSGLGRSYQTNQCWERMPGLSAKAHQASSQSITTTCTMPANDPRSSRVVTSWHLRGDTIYFDESGQYQLVVSGSNCTASVRRTRVLTRVVKAKEKPATLAPSAEPQKASPSAKAQAPETSPNGSKASPKTDTSVTVRPPPAPLRSDRCKNVGPPASLEISPKTKLMRAGESFQFQALVRDAAGCRLEALPEFRLDNHPAATLTSDGTLSIAADASSARLALSAQLGDEVVHMSARVVSHDEFETLLRGGGYGALGESHEVSSTVLTTESIQAGSTSEPTQSQAWLWAALGLLGVLSGLAAYLFLRGSGPAPTQPDSHPHEDEPTGTPLASEDHLREPEPAPAAPVPKGRICPVCGTRFPADSTFCGSDGARLIREN